MNTLKKGGNFLLDVARATAIAEIAKNPVFCAPVKEWGTGDTLWVASDEDMIFATQVITIDGHNVFIGSKK